ncbi:MAG: hypothetical protein U0271_06975 [Polyangiaceae bacterium]
MPLLILSAVLFLVGGSLLYWGVPTLRPWRRLSRLKTVGVAELTTGPGEITGAIEVAPGVDPIRSGTGMDCVAVVTIRERRTGKNVYSEVSRDTAVARAIVRDATGECELELDHVDIMGEVWEITHDDNAARMTQIIVPVGARVVASGAARVLGNPGGAAYRSGGGFVLAGTQTEPLILVVGAQTTAIRYAWRGAIACLGGLLLWGLTGLAVSLWVRVALAGH